MASFTSFQLKELDKLLNYGGYTPLIANSNNEFEIFFNRLGIDIYKDYYAGSKGKTLYNFWVYSPNDLALKVIKEIREIVLYEFANKYEERNKAEMLFNSIEKTLTNEFEINNNIFLQAINVFSFLESKNICHRDIRVNNILVTKEGILKIIDFGFGKIIENNGTLKSATRLVNYTFTLPKELNCNTPKYTKKTEIYFVGKLFEKLLADNNIKNFPYENIIKKMILEEPEDRIGSFLDVINFVNLINREEKILFNI